MKTKIIGIILTSTLIFAQPVITAIKLSPTTNLKWNKHTDPNVVDHKVTIKQGTNVWAKFIGNTNVTKLVDIHPTIVPGFYEFSVEAWNNAGLPSPPTTISTNLSITPTAIINLRIEVTLE